ncbi:FAD binding domain-containing protein [Saccharomonospora sp. NPDC006951]
MMVSAVHAPESLPAATRLLDHGGRVLGGGTLVMAAVNAGEAPSSELISLHRLGLSGITITEDGVRVGAATPLRDLLGEPGLAFLHPALRGIGSPTLRNTATVGGNLFAGGPYGDLAVCLLALDATVTVAGRSGTHATTVTGVTGTGGIVTSVRFGIPEPGTWRYLKAQRRRLNSASIVSVAAVIGPRADDAAGSTRIALGGVAPSPVRATSAEAVLAGRPLTATTAEAAGRAALADIAPADDAYASAWYRRRVLPVHLRRALLG